MHKLVTQGTICATEMVGSHWQFGNFLKPGDPWKMPPECQRLRQRSALTAFNKDNGA